MPFRKANRPGTATAPAVSTNSAALSRHDVAVVRDFQAVPAVMAERGKVLQILINLIRNDRSGSKYLVFSKHTSTLRELEAQLRFSGIQCVCVDGRTTQELTGKRSALFNSDPSVRVFLTSVSAGITVTAASVQIVFDPPDNVDIEGQLVARIDRIGQTKAIKIMHLCLANTIEDRLIARNEYLLQRKQSSSSSSSSSSSESKAPYKRIVNLTTRDRLLGVQPDSVESTDNDAVEFAQVRAAAASAYAERDASTSMTAFDVNYLLASK